MIKPVILPTQFIDNTRYLSNPYYRKGSFLIVDSESLNLISYHACRESIHILRTLNHRTNSNFMGFFYKDISIKKVRKCFKLIEKKLKLTKENHIIFLPTNNKDTILFELPPFWIENHARFSLFTLFLRFAVQFYIKGRLTDNFNKYPLLYITIDAIKFFLDGNIYFTDYALSKIEIFLAKGWNSLFEGSAITSFPKFLSRERQN